MRAIRVRRPPHSGQRNMVFDDPEWDFRTRDYERDLPVALAKKGDALAANSSCVMPA